MNAETMAILLGLLWGIAPLPFLSLVGKMADGADRQDER